MGRRPPRPDALKRTLDRLYAGFDFAGRVLHDPISAPMDYPAPLDREAAAFIAAALAYGRVGLFMPVTRAILAPMGASPAAFLAAFDLGRDARRFRGVKYRFQQEGDLVDMLAVLGRAYKTHGSLEALFMAHYDAGHEDIGPALGGFMGALQRLHRGAPSRGLRHCFPSPATGGAAKRACLFLRWMVRRADIDFGLWRAVEPGKLVIPLDTHILRVGQCLGLTARKAAGWATAREITASLRALDPEDPLRYDFALCHQGISGVCASSKCAGCEIKTG
jgi:uncharacterized protein (TIGR02757 family)